MPFNGSGGFAALAAPNFPAVAGATIIASYYNNVLNDLFAGMGQVVARDGQSPWTANLPAGGFRVTGLGAGTANGESVAFGQATVSFGTVTAAFSGALTGSVTGHASLDLALTGGVMSGALSVVQAGPSIVTASGTGGAAGSGGAFYTNNGASTVGAFGEYAAIYGGAVQNAVAVYSSGYLSLAAGGTERARIDTSGNFGVSVTPTAKLHMLGAELRMQTDSVFLTGYNTAGSTRRGYLQFNTTDVSLGAEGASNSLLFATNGSTRLSVTSDGRVFGSGLHNNAGAVTGTVNQYIASGTYTPTLTANTNCSSLVANGTAKWMRVGNVVSVAGAFTYTVTTGGVQTISLATLPIASTLAVNSHLSGSGGHTLAGQINAAVNIFADTAGNRAAFSVIPPAAGASQIVYYIFSYEVL